MASAVRCISMALILLLTQLTTLFQQDPKDQGSLAVDLLKLPAPTEEQNIAAETLNGFRSLHGLSNVTIDRRLNASALLQASTMAKNGVLSHKQTSGDSADAQLRAKKYGYEGSISELVAFGMPNSPYAVVSFIDAPYHRRLLLKPGQFEFGCATESGYSCMVLGGSVEPKLVLSPPPSSEGVPTSWDGIEEPNPMRGTNLKAPFGYPILLSVYSTEQSLKLVSYSIVSPNGKLVDCVIKTPENDTETKDSFIIVPKKPFEAKSIYTVEVRFSVGDSERKETWSFKTGESNTPPPKKSKKKGE